jgi:hypothetical protein
MQSAQAASAMDHPLVSQPFVNSKISKKLLGFFTGDMHSNKSINRKYFPK